ncbi:sialate O-acetylesterase [Flavobacterium sp. 5]|uniref:sialate O-acetylesterase n=1 Tax=Flavobacterium sp. 5 TaxID=2035199 RepID=UPI000C2BBAF5|nr:sialate O-acetylesterase [Flavobacterium sp. 5]PKB16401.1 sialate O-acetylesterase [Flavobacterium sp. 5]
MKYLLLVFSVFLVFQANMRAQIKLPRLISNGVVLQRNEELKIWGWAAANENVQLKFNSKVYFAKADNTGNWVIILPKQKAGGPYEMVFEASNSVTVSDVLFGDVWVCSGQSNMELPMERLKEKYGEEIKNATNSKIRQFLVADKYNLKKEETDFDSGSWVSCSPKNVLDFSAVAYFFATAIYAKEGVPIGLVNTALGGSPVESWMSKKALKSFPEAYQEAEKFKNDALIEEITKSDQKRSDDWYAELNSKDKGFTNGKPVWNQSNTDLSDWKEMTIPGYWANESLGNINGVVWFKKEFTVPNSFVGKSAKLVLGRIVDQDFAYINGDYVGTTGYQYPPRKYEIGSSVLKEGKNTITVRVINNSGQGGFVLDKPYCLVVGNDSIDLKGNWKYQLGTEMKPLIGSTFIRWKPEGLYNAMIAPLLNFKIKGVIWYQGESNAGNPYNYKEAFSTMITDWRTNWKQGDFPFLFVQLANFMESNSNPVESNWARLRQAQYETLAIPNTGMAVITDIGEWNDIHPLNKEDVGKRLALQARKFAYGETKLVASSPSPNTFKFENDQVIIDFKDVGKGLVVKKGTDLKSFAISNDGINFVWAKAEIIGNQVKVWNPEIKSPTIVRYAWADNPADANLFSKEGLPATPFEIKKKN